VYSFPKLGGVKMFRVIATIVMLTLTGLLVVKYNETVSAPDGSLASVFATAFVLFFLLVGLIAVWAPKGKGSESNQIKTMARKPKR